MNPKVTVFTQRNYAEVKEIVNDATKPWGGSWNKFILELYSPKFKPDKNTFRFILLHENNVIGTFILKREIDACVPYFLAIRKDMRGKGIGTKILKFIETFAKRKKLQLIRLDTAQELRRNVHFYLQAGFTKSGKAKNIYMLGDTQIFFYKQLW